MSAVEKGAYEVETGSLWLVSLDEDTRAFRVWW